MGTHKDFAIVSVLHRHRAAADERAKALVELVNEVTRMGLGVSTELWDARERAVALLADTKYIDDIEHP